MATEGDPCALDRTLWWDGRPTHHKRCAAAMRKEFPNAVAVERVQRLVGYTRPQLWLNRATYFLLGGLFWAGVARLV